jgi:hypothetical protein
MQTGRLSYMHVERFPTYNAIQNNKFELKKFNQIK